MDVAACANRYANDSEKIGKDVQRMERDWKDQDKVLEDMVHALGVCAKEKIDKAGRLKRISQILRYKTHNFYNKIFY